MKTVRRPPIYPSGAQAVLPCSSLTPLPLSSRRPSVSFGGFGFSGTLADMDAYLDLGLHISVGMQVHKKAEGYEDIVQGVPKDRLLLETDAVGIDISPGNPPEPATLALIARVVASLRGVSLESLEEKTTEVLERLAGPLH